MILRRKNITCDGGRIFYSLTLLSKMTSVRKTNFTDNYKTYSTAFVLHFVLSE